MKKRRWTIPHVHYGQEGNRGALELSVNIDDVGALQLTRFAQIVLLVPGKPIRSLLKLDLRPMKVFNGHSMNGEDRG